MNRLGIFVDAGYLFAQGSAALSGSNQPRHLLSLNEQAAITHLLQTADELSGGIPLLRVYWYDAVSPTRGPSLDQERLAFTQNVKVRMGALNSHGQQKGVDSMIVIDLIELARNHAISDAVLLSGDEDVRVGVQFAQSYGVRVHLIGITPSRGSQSPSLIQEADTHTEWGVSAVQSFLSLRQPQHVQPQPPIETAAAANHDASQGQQADTATGVDTEETLRGIVATLVAELVPHDITTLKQFWQSERSVPREFDGRLLGKTRDALGRELTREEIKNIRRLFKQAVTQS